MKEEVKRAEAEGQRRERGGEESGGRRTAPRKRR